MRINPNIIAKMIINGTAAPKKTTQGYSVTLKISERAAREIKDALKAEKTRLEALDTTEVKAERTATIADLDTKLTSYPEVSEVTERGI